MSNTFKITMELHRTSETPLMVYFAGPSGSGKTYLAKKLVEKFPEFFHKPLQVTTRQPRENEIEGIDYNFLTRDDYENSYLAGRLFSVTKIGEIFYGTPYKNLKDDKINIIVVDKGGYETRHQEADYECLIGFDYNYDAEKDIKRVIGRTNRDQRMNFLEFKDEYKFDEILMNNSDNYIKEEDFKNIIFKIFISKGALI